MSMTKADRGIKLRLVDDHPSLGGRLQLLALKTVRGMLMPFAFRGLGAYCRLAHRIFGDQGVMVALNLPGGGVFNMPIYDLSWQSYLYRNRTYEPEIEAFVSRHIEGQFDWLDCGANFGYWSVWLAGRRGTDLGRIIAIEPSPHCLPVLRRNVAHNTPAIDLVEKAIHRQAGLSLAFVVKEAHVASHLLDQAEGDAEGTVETVQTTTLDELATQFGLGNRPIIVKLDVEGQEINAISGASRLAKSDVIYLYEDHGKDLECETSAFLLGQGYSVFALEDQGQTKLTSVEAVRALKVSATKGYNFAATQSRYWLGLLGQQGGA